MPNRLLTAAQQPYWHGPDSERHADVPRGEVTHHVFRSGGLYPGTIRELWGYVPAQYDGGAGAALMVLQDGHAFVSETGDSGSRTARSSASRSAATATARPTSSSRPTR